MKNTEEDFNHISKQIENLNNQRASNSINFPSYINAIDQLFANRTWTKKEYFEELQVRAGKLKRHR